jgi:HPt (histidine-containing phosphotransfer) domain-containing protein
MENVKNTMGSGSQTLIPNIPGVDTAKGIAKTGGTIAGYRQVLSMFCKDVVQRLQLLRYFLFESMSGNRFPEKHLASFVTQVHALKSASASLGAEEMSEKAGQLEEAGHAKDLNFIWENLSGFVQSLTELVDNIHGILKLFPEESDPKPDGQETTETETIAFFFNELAAALKSQNVSNIDRVLEELSKKSLDSKTKEILEQVSDQVLMVEFDSAIRTLNELVK